MSASDSEAIRIPRIAKNGLWNLLGLVGPLPVAVLSIPILVSYVGAERFGVLTLVWMLVGYFNLFDLGIGRALTQLIANRLGRGPKEGLGNLAWSGLVLMGALGCIGGIALIAVADVLTRSVLNIPTNLQRETSVAFYLLAPAIPLTVMTSGLRGILEALQRFDVANAIRVPTGLLTYLAPLGSAICAPSLPALVGALVIVRALAWLAHVYCCLRFLPELRAKPRFERSSVRLLLGFGGWMTVSNVVSPVMAYFDRFLIGSILTMTMVAHYTTSFELVSRVSLLPSAVASALFPAFASGYVTDLAGTARLFTRGTKVLTIILFPLSIVIVAFAREILQMWMGSEFAAGGTRALQWLATGTFINCLAFVPFALIQGMGRPRITALIHLIELPLYIATLTLLTRYHGIEGAAIAWTLRVSIDALLMFWTAGAMLRDARRVMSSFLLLVLAISGVALWLSLVDDLCLRGIATVAVLLMFSCISWTRILDDQSRAFVRRLVTRHRN